MATATRKCSMCSDRFPREQMTIRGTMAFCCIDCMVQYGLNKGRKEIKKKAAVKNREDKFRVKSYARKMADLKLIFNKLRRLQEFKWFRDRDLQPTCISCSRELGGDQWANGHYKTTAARPDIMFDPMNSYLQHNNRCNKNLSGDIENYPTGIIHRFGEEEGNKILDYCAVQQESKKYTDEDIVRMRSEWRNEIRDLEDYLS